MFADLWKKIDIFRADVWSYILLINAVTDSRPMKDIYYFGAIKVFIQIESRIMLPAP